MTPPTCGPTSWDYLKMQLRAGEANEATGRSPGKPIGERIEQGGPVMAQQAPFIARSLRATILIVVGLLLLFAAAGCLTGGDTLYTCTYETRHTGCGGSPWNAWETRCYAFDLDDYLEGWTAQDVCDKYTGSDLECAGGCCIYVEYRNNQLSNDDFCP